MIKDTQSCGSQPNAWLVLFKSQTGIHCNLHRKPDSVYFHHTLQGFLCSVRTIFHQISLTFWTTPAFISYFPLPFSPFLDYMDWLSFSPARRNPSFLKGGWEMKRERMHAGTCRTLFERLVMRRLWTIHIDHFWLTSLSKADGCSHLGSHWFTDEGREY